MIHGIGTDLVQLRRMRAALERHGERFALRILAASEVDGWRAHRDPARYLAKRFAAKEAFAKAVGTGFDTGVSWKDVGVVNTGKGAPTISLTGGAAARLAALTPPGHQAVVHLTLTDDHPWAQAFVIIEAIKD